MLDILETIETHLPPWLLQNDWNSLYIDYHPPIVERLWRTFEDKRISLHCIHPCEAHQALFHPHPWPSAMRVLQGEYEMAVGFGPGDTPPPHASRIIAEGGRFSYEMTHPDAWHYVRPIQHPVYTVMVTGAPWSRSAPRSQTPLQPLPPSRVQSLLETFRTFYPLTQP